MADVSCFLQCFRAYKIFTFNTLLMTEIPSLVPRPNVTQLRVDYITATRKLSGDVIHPQMVTLGLGTRLRNTHGKTQTTIEDRGVLLG